MEDATALAEEVSNMLSSQNLIGALQKGISSPPRTKNQDVRDKVAETVVSVLASIKESQVPKFVEDLSPDERDQVMKYVFKGFATGENCSALLKWHAKIVEANGIGAITRSMTDRKV